MSLPEPIFDAEAIAALKRKAAETGPKDILTMVTETIESGGKEIREHGIDVEPGYHVALTITVFPPNIDCYQLSVSSKFGPLTIEMMEKFTVAFGLGTRDSWFVNLPPGLQQAYNVFKRRGH